MITFLSKFIISYCGLDFLYLLKSGEMTLKIVSSRQIQAVEKSGGFGGSNWTR